MRPQLRLGWGGLRGRLLVAFVLTSAVTLAAAAAVVLGPLQQRLRDHDADDLVALEERPRAGQFVVDDLPFLDAVDGRSDR